MMKYQVIVCVMPVEVGLWLVEQFDDDDVDEVDAQVQQNDFDAVVVVVVHCYELIIVHDYLQFLKERLRKIIVDAVVITMMDQMLQENEQVVVVVVVDDYDDDFQMVQQVKLIDLDDQPHL